MANYKITRTHTMQIVGYIDWQTNNKNYDSLLKELEKRGIISNVKNYFVMVEHFGLCLSILDRRKSVEFLYLTIQVEEAPVLKQ